MKIIYNNIIPFKGFIAINLFGIIFVRKKYKAYIEDNYRCKITINHESIHTAQMKELLYVGFYVWYFIEWIIQLILNIKHPAKAYYEIKFEKEAYDNQNNFDYLKIRKHYSWLQY